MVYSLTIVTCCAPGTGLDSACIDRLLLNLEKYNVWIHLLHREKLRIKSRRKFSNLNQSTYSAEADPSSSLENKLLWMRSIVHGQQVETEFVIWINLPELMTFFGGPEVNTSLLERMESFVRSYDKLVFINDFFIGGRRIQWLQLVKLIPVLAQRIVQTDVSESLFSNFKELALKINVTSKDPVIFFRKKLMQIPRTNLISTAKTSLYVISFNAPQQFRVLLGSLHSYAPDFLKMCSKTLVNNSTDDSMLPAYDSLCKEFGFSHIKKNNIGISGGRQFVAEHFEKSERDFYICFEDDMLLHQPSEVHCRSGFPTYIPDLYLKSLKIMIIKGFDFLKMSFTEVFNDHSMQWAWYTVSDSERKKYFRERPILKIGLRPPATFVSHIERLDEISFAVGEFYYSNWPSWTSRKGNRRIFLQKILAQPSEDKWMSSVFVKQRRKEISAAVLLASPINHNRVHSYQLSERKES